MSRRVVNKFETMTLFSTVMCTLTLRCPRYSAQSAGGEIRHSINFNSTQWRTYGIICRKLWAGLGQ